jgi:hypothetical protein
VFPTAFLNLSAILRPFDHFSAFRWYGKPENRGLDQGAHLNFPQMAKWAGAMAIPPGFGLRHSSGALEVASLARETCVVHLQTTALFGLGGYPWHRLPTFSSLN